jgi:hypothetical protein
MPPVKTSATIKASQWLYDKIYETQNKTGLPQHEALDLIVKDLINANVSLEEKYNKLLDDHKKTLQELTQLKQQYDEAVKALQKKVLHES